MFHLRRFFLLLFISSTAWADDMKYELGPDSHRQKGVPEGTVTKHHLASSKIFEETNRDYWIYVPALAKDVPPPERWPVMVFQDGHAYVNETGEFRATIVLDNLIAKGEIPARHWFRLGRPLTRMIEQRMDVLRLDGPIDYRLARLERGSVYFTPLGKDADEHLETIWFDLTGVHAGTPSALEVMGRKLDIPEQARGAARFTFEQLCAAALGP